MLRHRSAQNGLLWTQRRLPAGAANERAESAGRDLCTGCRVATRAGCFTVRHSRCPVWSDVADLLTGGPSRLALAQAPVPKVAAAAITGLDITDSRYPDPQPGIASSFGSLADPGWCIGRGWYLLMGLAPLSSTWPADEGHQRSGAFRPGDITVWAARPTFRTAPGAIWCRLCRSRAWHDGVHGTIAWGTCGARSTATRSDTSTREPLRLGFMGRSSRRTI